MASGAVVVPQLLSAPLRPQTESEGAVHMWPTIVAVEHRGSVLSDARAAVAAIVAVGGVRVLGARAAVVADVDEAGADVAAHHRGTPGQRSA